MEYFPVVAVENYKIHVPFLWFRASRRSKGPHALILVLFLRHKGTQGVNDIRSLEEEGKDVIPIRVGG